MIKFVQQPVKIDEKNLDLLIGGGLSGDNLQKHGSLLPNSIRCIICGPSNCGKTNVLLSLLIDANGVKFENVYIYSKSLNQPKYKFLRQLLKDANKKIGFFPFEDSETVIEPNKARPNSVFIFDDIACDSQSPIRAFFSRGRHAQVDCFLLCQTYSSIPKQLVRDNANIIVLFRQDDLNLDHVYRDHVNTDMSFQQFKDACALCWNKNLHGYLVIDKERDLNNGRYRRGFDDFMLITKSKTIKESRKSLRL